MTQHLIFQPIGALGFLTFLVLMIIPVRRFAAGRKGLVKVSDFTFGESANVPGEVSIPNRNLMNLLELPVLFYVICLMYDIAGKVDLWILSLAWIYVALRVVHSAIHLTYNDVHHRLAVFAASNVVLLVSWISFFVR